MVTLKNPNRQVAQYRRMLDRQRNLLRFAFLFWLVPLGLLGVSLLRGWHWSVATLLCLAVLSGAVQHFNARSRLVDYQLKKAAVEETAAQSEPAPTTHDG